MSRPLRVQNPSRLGFTLIETLACLVIVGLLAGGAALSLRGLSRNIQAEAWLQRVVHLDTTMRLRAEAQGRPWRLIVDLERQRLQATPGPDSSPYRSYVQSGGNSGGTLTLPVPPSLHVERLVVNPESVSGGTGDVASAPAEMGSGQVALTCSPLGLAPSYALILRDNDHRTVYLLVLASGQPRVINDEEAFDNLLASLGGTGHDAY